MCRTRSGYRNPEGIIQWYFRGYFSVDTNARFCFPVRVSKQDSEKLLQGSVQGRIMERNISVIKDVNGNQIVIVNDIRFKGKRNIDWDEVEQYLRQYVGEFIEIAESKEIIYIGSDLPDEYSGSNYTAKLKGALAKAKANAAQGIPEIIEIAENKRFQENLERKHRKNAKYGWYRYDSRFAIPVFDENNDVLRYHVFHAELVTRYSENRKLYLYDIINIKKKRVPRLSHKTVRLKTHFLF